MTKRLILAAGLLFILLSPALALKNTILFLGDDLTHPDETGSQENYPYLIQQKLKDDGLKWYVKDASQQGYTSTQAADELDWIIRFEPRVVVIALGWNDALAGVPASLVRDNIDLLALRLISNQIGVVLVGIVPPASVGTKVQAEYRGIYRSLAAKHGIRLYPSLISGLEATPSRYLDDNQHPTQEGHALIAEHLYKWLKPSIVHPPEPEHY